MKESGETHKHCMLNVSIRKIIAFADLFYESTVFLAGISFPSVERLQVVAQRALEDFGLRFVAFSVGT